MYITTCGSNRKTQNLAKDVAQYCAEMLMGKRLTENIDLRIEFTNNLDKDNYIEGDCEWTDDENRPREFTIRVKETLSLGRKLRTICHEMVHVKQYATGEMKSMYRPARTTKFRGEYFPDELDYWECPWEIEAFGREAGLYTRWIDEHKKFTDHPVFDSRNEPEVISPEEIAFLSPKTRTHLKQATSNEVEATEVLQTGSVQL